MNTLPVKRDLALAHACSLVVTVLIAVVSAAGLMLAPTGLYGVDPSLMPVFIGQDAANLLVGLPILLVSAWLAHRGSLVGLLFWPGALFYVLYTYTLYLVGTPFNAHFLPYVALVVLSAYTTIGVVASIAGEHVRRRRSQAPARTVGGALVGLGLLATAGLTFPVIAALASSAPVDPLLHARWIVDYTVGNPVLLLGGVLLWRRAGLGYATAGGLLFLSGTNGVAFAVGGVLGALLTASPIDATLIAVHLVISAISFALLAVFLRGADRPPTGEELNRDRGTVRQEASASQEAAAELPTSWILPSGAGSARRLRRFATERAVLAALTVAILAGLAWASLRVLAMPSAVPATAPSDQFSSARAFAHSKAIAQAPHPTGSAEHARVRDHIIGQIRSFGLQAEVQQTVAVHPDWGTAFQVENILVRLPGSVNTRAVLIVGHYDGVASGPGTGNNGVSVASMLEVIRTLHARDQLRNDVNFLFPDAEEYGLVGAYAFVQEHPWARDVGVVFNFDATDGRGPLVLRKTAAEDGWLVRNLAAAHVGAFPKSQQNSERGERWGTDFDVFEQAGYTAGDMNNWTSNASYHTRLDSIDKLDQRKLQNYGAAMMQLAQHFGALDLRDTRGRDRVFVSLFDRGLVVHYPNSWTWPLTGLATAGVAGVLALGLYRRRLGPLALAKSTGALLALIVVAIFVSDLAWKIIVSAHPEAAWQQELDIYQGQLLLGGVISFVAAAFFALFAWGGRRLGIASIQAGALILTLLLALFGAASDPLFSYVALWPLFAVTAAAGIAFVISADETGRPRRLRAAVFWLAAVPVLGVFIPNLARLTLISTQDGPALAAAVVVLVLAMLASAVDLALPSYRAWLAGLAVVTGVALLAVGTARSGFSAEQPQPHTLYYALNADSGAAQWATLDDDPDAWLAQFVPSAAAQTTTAEAVLGISASPRDATDWLIPSIAARASDAPALDVPAPRLEVLAHRRAGDLHTLSLRVSSPRNGRLVYVVPDLEVARAAIEGKPVDVYPGWRFIFVALPAEGVELELVLRGAGPARLTVVDQTDGLPAALRTRYSLEPEDTMPAILPRWARGYPTFVTKTYVFD